MAYKKLSVVDQHQFFLDTEGQIKPRRRSKMAWF